MMITERVIDLTELLKLAAAEIGYKEKASNHNLDSKTANAGSGNWTKYARDLDAIPGFYNGAKNGYPWCAAFVDWLFVKTYGVEKTKLMTFHTTLGAGCVYAASRYRTAGQWFTKPQAGDEIFFGDRGDEYHTGIVEKVDGTYVYTIEGNTSPSEGVVDNGGEVCRKKYRLSYSGITGYGRPKYDGEVVVPPEEKQEDDEVKLPMIQRGATGDNVRSLQILLEGYGYDVGTYGTDGDFGADTESAVRRFQTAKKLEVDGIVGNQTWSALLGV